MKRCAAALAAMLALTLCTAVSAQGSDGVVTPANLNLIDEDGVIRATGTGSGGDCTFEVAPGQTLYLCLGTGSGNIAALISADTGVASPLNNAAPKDLADSDSFKLKVDRSGDGKSLLKIAQYNDRSFGNSARSAWLKIEIAGTQALEELKAEAQLTFSARHDSGERWKAGDYAELDLTFWIQNELTQGDEAEAEAGDAFVFQPVANEQNMVTWDRVASLAFSASDDASKFYAKLSTKVDPLFYSLYGDPVDAELFFYDFTGSPAISATSRAVLTLCYPWDLDDKRSPAPGTCRIYSKNTDGELIDVSSLFTYLQEDEEGTLVEGWRTRVRTLGCYIISDKPLDTTVTAGQVEEKRQEQAAKPAGDGGFDLENSTKSNPPTGK